MVKPYIHHGDDQGAKPLPRFVTPSARVWGSPVQPKGAIHQALIGSHSPSFNRELTMVTIGLHHGEYGARYSYI